jgi:hypothetical protein|tara:strand:- start:806 stop:940 length:135 start_codon:yes stop_codon:yes gene_type:complete
MNKIFDWVWNPLKSLYNFWDKTLSNKGKLVVAAVVAIILFIIFI